MALPICSRRPLRLLQRMTISPNTNVLLPRIQRASFAQVNQSASQLTETQEIEMELSKALAGSAKGKQQQSGQNEQEVPDRLQKVSPKLRDVLGQARIPKALHTMYMKPLRRKPTHGHAVCDLQLRSFSVRGLELYADFAMRAAYYLGLVARGPIPLPKITQRYTVIRSNFVHKKSQENFERVHVRRLIQIQDGDPVVVQCWLGYLQKKQFHGVGMKANIYEHEELGVGRRMDKQAGVVDADMEEEWGNFGIRMNAVTAEKVEELLGSKAFSKPRRDLEAFYREPIEIKRDKQAES